MRLYFVLYVRCTLMLLTSLLTFCHGHEGMSYVTRPWASDEEDIPTIKGQYRHSPQGECQQSEEQPQTSISYHLPRGECQHSTSSVAKELHHSPMGE